MKCTWNMDYKIIKLTTNHYKFLNTILTDSEQEKKRLKRKIRKDFYKIKQELELVDYKLDDLRFVNIDN